MSGYKSSERQRMSGRVRAFLAVFLALSMLIPMAVSVYAQDVPAVPTETPVEEPAAVEAPAAEAPVEAAAEAPAAEAPVEAAAAVAEVEVVSVEQRAVQPYGEICVEGTVINFDETLLPTREPGEDYSEDIAWVITATQLGAALQTFTDEDAYFEFKAKDDQGNPNFQPGLVKFSIAIPAGSGWEAITPAEFSIDLKYQDHCQVIRFKLKRPVQVDVLKIDDDHNSLEGWVMKATPGHDNWFASSDEMTTTVDGIATFYLTEGKWIFTERAPKHTHYTAVMPSDGKQELKVEWNNGKPIQIRFKNRLAVKGCVDVNKFDTAPDVQEVNSTYGYGLPDWKMTLMRMDGSVVDTRYTDAQGKASFTGLPFGTYIVEEESRTGWAAEPSQSTKVYVKVDRDQGDDRDQCAVVDFYNYQDAGFCIQGRKIDTNGKIGIPGWEITATPVAKGGYPDPNVDPEVANLIEDGQLITLTEGDGTYRFDFPKNDYRIPGAAYKVCEDEVDGWLPHTPLCQTVYLPKKPGACVKAWDFENQQVGHWESVVYGKHTGSSSSCAYTHTVQPGESLYGIGAAYGVSASAMLSANPWIYSRPHYYVYPGDSVCIP